MGSGRGRYRRSSVEGATLPNTPAGQSPRTGTNRGANVMSYGLAIPPRRRVLVLEREKATAPGIGAPTSKPACRTDVRSRRGRSIGGPRYYPACRLGH